MELRFATTVDGVPPEVAARRTAYVLDRPGEDDSVVRTWFDGPTVVRTEGAEGLSVAERAALLDEVTYWSPQVTTLVVGDEELVAPDPRPITWVALADLTVGQLTVDETKVAGHAWVARPEDVVLACCRLGDELMVVDGHSRAVAALRAGITRVGVVEEVPGTLQVEARRWCREAGLVTVADLARQGVVDPVAHRRLWVDRCQAWLRAHPDD